MCCFEVLCTVVRAQSGVPRPSRDVWWEQKPSIAQRAPTPHDARIRVAGPLIVYHTAREKTRVSRNHAMNAPHLSNDHHPLPQSHSPLLA